MKQIKQSDLINEVSNFVKNILELDTVDLSYNFYDLGGHSMLAIEFINFMKNTFDIEVTANDLFEFDLNEIIEHSVKESI